MAYSRSALTPLTDERVRPQAETGLELEAWDK